MRGRNPMKSNTLGRPRTSLTLIAVIVWALTLIARADAQPTFEELLKFTASFIQDLKNDPRKGIDELPWLTSGLKDAEILLSSLEVKPVIDDVVEYSFLVKVGPGEREVIRLHRVVRASQSGSPVPAEHAIFMVHGDWWGFNAAFLGSAISSKVPRNQAIAVFLAQNNVDVWGIDLRWVQAPGNTTNFSFMRDWSIATHIQDLSVGLGIARFLRGVSGLGFSQMILLGWSNGGILSYALANEETRYPEKMRHLRGMIPVDIAFKFSPTDEPQRIAACKRYASFKAEFDSGILHNDIRFLRTIGQLAATSPDAPSPFAFARGLTNKEAALLFGAAVYRLAGDVPVVPFYHYVAGKFTESGVPADLTYTKAAYFYDLLQNGAPYQSWKESVEREMIWCNEAASPYADRLKEVSIPVFYVGAEGGFGSFGKHSTTLLGSKDLKNLIITHTPPPTDFGHTDLFSADNARTEVWEPIHNWIVTHPATSLKNVANVSSASFSGAMLAGESIVAAFGSNLATSTQAATTLPLPASLAGTTVKVKDSVGTERLAPLFFVSTGQVNYQVPPGTTAGAAIIIITSGDGSISAGTAQIAAVAPGLFTFNGDGRGVPSGYVLRYRNNTDVTTSDDRLADLDAQNMWVPHPLNLGPETDQVFLVLFGTGIRSRSDLSRVNVKIGGTDAAALYAGPQGAFVGLDQVNLLVPRSLIGRGVVDVVVTIDAKIANTVKVHIR